MSKNIAARNVIGEVGTLRDQVNRLQRAPTGQNSIGGLYLLPGKKAGIPSDADYPSSALPPIGTMVYDTTNSKIWVRHAAGTWKGVVVA